MNFKRIFALLSLVAICAGLVSCGCKEHTDSDYDGKCDSCEEILRELPQKGSSVGSLCPVYALEKMDGGTVRLDELRGKIVVINFWGTWCNPCKSELPDFDRVASERDDVAVLAIHSSDGRGNAPEYVSENFPDSKMIFAYDKGLPGTLDMYYGLLGGEMYYPRTVIVDKYGVITFATEGVISHDKLVAEINKAKGN